MNKLLSFAKIAGICLLLPLLFQVILLFSHSYNHFLVALDLLIGLIPNVLWIIFFSFLIKASVKSSPVIAPSYVAIVAFGIALIANFLFPLLSELTKGWDGELGIASNVLNLLVYPIVVAVAFIWLSKFFQKGSTLKITCIVIALVALINIIFTLLFRNWTVVVIGISVSLIAQIVFFFAFSKINNQ